MHGDGGMNKRNNDSVFNCPTKVFFITYNAQTKNNDDNNNNNQSYDNSL